MPKKGRRKGAKNGPGSKRGKAESAPDYASDDEQLYGDFEDPDSRSRSFVYDDVDEFHAGREKVLLDEGYQHQEEEEVSDEEVLGLDPEESDDEDIKNIKAQLRRIQRVTGKETLAGDLEEEDDDDSEEDDEEERGLPDSRAWGVKRNKYYGDDDIELKDLDDEEASAVLEEKEALKLQRQMAEQLDDQDFGLDIFKAPEEEELEETVEEEKIVKDLSKLSQREKLKLLKKDSPELITLIDDFKQKMSEIQDKLLPVKSLIQKQQFKGSAAEYIHAKYKLNLNYCINILFYLMLKAKQAMVHNHPVIKRLLQYRSMMKQLEPVDGHLEKELGQILDKLNSGHEVSLGQLQTNTPPRTFVRRKKEAKRKSAVQETMATADSGSDGDDSDDLYEDFGKPKKPKKMKVSEQFVTEDEKAALDFYASMKERKGKSLDEEDQEQGSEDEGADQEATAAAAGAYNDYWEEEEGDGKRAITYQIEKNKGLTAKKKKELRNPRVKHRMKFRKAMIRRTGQFRTPKTEMKKYGGETSGIRLGVKRGVRLH